MIKFIGVFALGTAFIAIGTCHAITIEQVTRGHDLIEKISAEKKQIDQLKSDDCDDHSGWYTYIRYLVHPKSAAPTPCNPCSGTGSVIYFGSSGYIDPGERTITMGLDKKHALAAMQSQLDDDMAELNKLGITP